MVAIDLMVKPWRQNTVCDQDSWWEFGGAGSLTAVHIQVSVIGLAGFVQEREKIDPIPGWVSEYVTAEPDAMEDTLAPLSTPVASAMVSFCEHCKNKSPEEPTNPATCVGGMHTLSNLLVLTMNSQSG